MRGEADLVCFATKEKAEELDGICGGVAQVGNESIIAFAIGSSWAVLPVENGTRT